MSPRLRTECEQLPRRFAYALGADFSDGTLPNRGAARAISDPVSHPYTTAEPHSPVGKSLRAAFDGLLSGRLLVALVDEI
jgi:hypothetical protein